MISSYINPFFYYPNRNWLVAKDTLFFLRCYLENGFQPFSASEFADITDWIVKKNVKKQIAATVVLWDEGNKSCLFQEWEELIFEKMPSKNWNPEKIFKSKKWKNKFDKRLIISGKGFPGLVKNHQWMGHYGILKEEDMETLLLQFEEI